MAETITSESILNEEQLTKHIKVYAGPGAGKTHFLVENIKNIIKTNNSINKSKVRKVLCITYTNSAVEEIKRRLEKYSDYVEICTIHTFIIEHIISVFQQELKKIINKEFNISINKKSKLTSQIEGLGILHGCDKEDIYRYINENLGTNDIISYSKKIMGEVEVDIQNFFENEEVVLKYSNKIQTEHVHFIKQYIWSEVCKLTHDEILYFGYKILKECSIATYALRVKFPFIFVDEFQDTNPLQTLIIKHLGEKFTRVGIVGDVAQSIYSFQGAKPSQFVNFNEINGDELVEYTIEGNYRCSQNIVSLCNYFRKDDQLFQQSIKKYESEIEKQNIESKKIKFIIGEKREQLDLINSIIDEGGVILTRTWAEAFNYIKDIDEEQVEILRKIYNSYYSTPIDIRTEIEEHNNVSWVRAFKFIIMLQKSKLNGSFVDIVLAFKLYFDSKILYQTTNFMPSLIMKISRILDVVFKDLKKDTIVVDLINKFNELVRNDENNDVFLALNNGEIFQIPYLTEYDEKIKDSISSIKWDTADKLFNKVFSKESQ